MGRYDKMKNIVDANIEFESEQERLHKKHDEVDPNAVIVEKSSAVRATLSFFESFIRTAAMVVLIILAVIGLLSLIYPNIREQLIIVLSQIWHELGRMIGMK